jgi:sigma-B regulation protein RsbU (phosphoserine phosphatase)
LIHEGKITELGGNGPALGLLSEAEFAVDEEQILRSPGDRLALYTDGLCDILNTAGLPFGRERFTALLGSYAPLPASELCTAIFTDLTAYRGESEQYDDMTLVILEVEM